MTAALEIRSLRGGIATAGPGGGSPQVSVDHAVLLVRLAGLQALIPSEAPIKIVEMDDGLLQLSFQHGVVRGLLRLRPLVTAAGTLGLELRSASAWGLPVPHAMVETQLRRALADKPGVTLTPGAPPAIDLATIVRPMGIRLPPLTRVAVRTGELECEFGQDQGLDGLVAMDALDPAEV